MRRSMLFLPGNNPNMLINGNCLGSDAVIFDLEDAVAPDQKDAARILVRNTMRYMDFRGCELIVRINSIDTPYWQQDIDEVLPYKPNLILLPKTGSADDAQQVDAYMTQVEEKLGMEPNTVGLMALIETAMGVENAFSIATATKRVQALFLGAEDLTADLQCKRTKEGREIEYARSRMVMAARAAGIEVYDTPFTDVNDDEGIEVELFQSNHEGAIVDKIQEAYGVFDGIVINPAAYTHTSVAILDALKAVSVPTAEVHISDINEREEFRKHSYVSMVAKKTICGLGFEGYAVAIRFLKNYLSK